MSDRGAGAGAGERERIEGLVAELEALDDPRARQSAQQLLGLVLEMHRSGIARLLEIVDGADAGQTITERFVVDDDVAALLLLHGLHPHELGARVRRALEKSRPHLAAHSIALELVSASEAEVRIKVSALPAPASRGPRLAVAEIRREIEAAIFAQAPDVAKVEIEGLASTDVTAIRFMPRPTSRGSAVRADAATGTTR